MGIETIEGVELGQMAGLQELSLAELEGVEGGFLGAIFGGFALGLAVGVGIAYLVYN